MNLFALRRTAYGRLVRAFLVLALVLVAGSSAYYYVGDGRWTWLETFYMTIITVSTVGFAEVLPGMDQASGARVVTVMLILVGSGTLLYFASSLTASIVEGDLPGALRRRRTMREISKLNGHIIVCGVGTTGHHIVEELLAGVRPVVAIDADADKLSHLAEAYHGRLLTVHGDATDDAVLVDAGLERAFGVISALNDDKANLFVTVTARALNPSARIVAKAIETATEPKLRRAGADAVVSPNYIGGVRIASEMVRPQTLAFLDNIVRDQSGISVGIDTVDVPVGSPLIGQRLADTSIREAGALVIAVRGATGDYVYNPQADCPIEAGASLVVLADPSSMSRLRTTLGGDAG